MKTLYWIGRIALLTVAVAVFAIVLGTMLPAIPVVGSIGSYITLGAYHIFIPILTVVTAAVLVLCIVKRKIINIVSLALLVAALVITCVCLLQVEAAFGRNGAEMSVWHTYRTENVKDVRTDTQVYATSATGDVSLNLYYTEDGKTDKPVVVYVHGGGWIGGSKEDHTYYSKVYAKEGYLACSIGYDLSTADSHLADSTETQLTAALAWLAQHAAQYGGDGSAVYLTGDSAGGNLALELAYKISGGIYQQYAGTALPSVKAVAVTYPVADPAGFWANPDVVLGAPSRNMCECYTGTTPADDPEAYRAITPVNYLVATSPATMMIVGEADTMVPPRGAYALDQALEVAGVAHRLVRLPYLNHGFDGYDGTIGSEGVLSLTLQWFAEHR